MKLKQETSFKRITQTTHGDIQGYPRLHSKALFEKGKEPIASHPGSDPALQPVRSLWAPCRKLGLEGWVLKDQSPSRTLDCPYPSCGPGSEPQGH